MKKRVFLMLLVSICAMLIIASCTSTAPAPTTTSPTQASATTIVSSTTATATPTATTKPAATTSTPKLPSRLDFSTHTAGSAAYAIATGLCKVASENGPIMVVAAPTTGPLAWVPQMAATGNPPLGNANCLDIFWIYFNEVAPVPVPDNMLGEKPFYPAAYKNIRLIAATGRMSAGFLVRADSPYKTPADLKGARLASGYLSQPSAFSPLIADLMNLQLTLKDFKEVPVTSPATGIPALGEGRVDAVHCGLGMSQTAEVDSKVKVRYLPASTDPAGVKRAQSLIPGAEYITRQTGEAPGILAPTPLLSFAQNVICPESLSEDVVYSLLSTWWNNLDKLQVLHPNLATIKSPQMFFEPKAAMPYHNGAIKFFKEKGLWTAAQDAYQARLLKGEKPFLD